METGFAPPEDAVAPYRIGSAGGNVDTEHHEHENQN